MGSCGRPYGTSAGCRYAAIALFVACILQFLVHVGSLTDKSQSSLLLRIHILSPGTREDVREAAGGVPGRMVMCRVWMDGEVPLDCNEAVNGEWYKRFWPFIATRLSEDPIEVRLSLGPFMGVVGLALTLRRLWVECVHRTLPERKKRKPKILHRRVTDHA